MAIRVILVSVAALLLTGACTHHSHYLTSKNAKYHEAYDDGFKAGCASYRTGSIVKDFRRAIHEPVYANGWDAGYTECQKVYYR